MSALAALTQKDPAPVLDQRVNLLREARFCHVIESLSLELSLSFTVMLLVPAVHELPSRRVEFVLYWTLQSGVLRSRFSFDNSKILSVLGLQE